MRWHFLGIVLVLFTSLALMSCSPPAPSAPVNEQPIEVLVTQVIDGDTIKVDLNGEIYNVRYIGIDCPETVNPNVSPEKYGQEATDFNTELVKGQTVRLEKDKTDKDRYDRLLRYVWVGDILVNAQLVAFGWAESTPYPPDTKYQQIFNDLEKQAKELKLGMWQEDESSPPPPPPPDKKVYVGTINSNIYHYPTCKWALEINPGNEIWFSSVEDAKAHGYRPCKICKPPG